jgi:mono/diheme cytochrome c family protein
MAERHPIQSLAGVPVLMVTLLIAACAGPGVPTADPARPAGGEWDVAQLYVDACAACHGPRGEGGSSGVPLGQALTVDRPLITRVIRYGVGGMPASSHGMSDEQIDALAAYVAGLR